MKKESTKIYESYTYNSKEERWNHHDEMIEDGWECVSGVNRLKPGISILDAKIEDREWYGEYLKYI